ncbi:Hypothetical predicted protein [Paramuricea clavata]|uniref:Uncharacterized protein n=1 Tax=Paramuricea clavata TaxID=317549 RepID=A0A6S7HRV0_PARCT|nr:Hypothetical predicted protein [Paramuricea clavata]
MIYYATKQTIARRKARHIRMRRLLRKKRSLWVKNGMTDAWWRNMIDGISPADDWKRNFRMSRERVQAVCDFKGYFMDVECRWPDSVHDAKNKLQSGELPQTFNNLLPGHNKIPNYVIGDPAYPLTPHCMKEFQSCKTDAEVTFNNMLRSARNPIECVFGRLKAWWSILTRKMDLKLETIPKVVLSCFVLHNFCELHNDTIDEKLVRSQVARNRSMETEYQNVPDPVYSCTTGEGEAI